MKAILTKLTLLVLFPALLSAQSNITKSETYHDMFPNNIDEQKLLIILPSKMTIAQIDSLLPDLSPRDVEASHKSHVMRTENTIEDVQESIKKYKLNCEVVHQVDYNLQSFPSDVYPLVVYPEVVTVGKFHVSHAYRMVDVSSNTKYGYARNTEATYTGNYFKQLDDYIKTLSTQKKGQVSNKVLSEKIEEDVARKQRRKGRIRAIAIGVLISMIVAATTVLSRN